MYSCETLSDKLSTSDRLDQIWMRPDQRSMAKASLRKAELVIDMAFRATGVLRRVLASIGRSFSVLAHGSRASAVRPELRLP
jgi:hypothetical protein